MEQLIFGEGMELKKRKRKIGAYKSWGYKKSKLNFTLDRSNGLYLKRMADIQGLSVSAALNKILFTIRTQDPQELVYLIREKKLELEWLKHVAKNKAILTESEEDVINGQ